MDITSFVNPTLSTHHDAPQRAITPSQSTESDGGRYFLAPSGSHTSCWLRAVQKDIKNVTLSPVVGMWRFRWLLRTISSCVRKPEDAVSASWCAEIFARFLSRVRKQLVCIGAVWRGSYVFEPFYSTIAQEGYGTLTCMDKFLVNIRHLGSRNYVFKTLRAPENTQKKNPFLENKGKRL